eukprot:5134133-Pleurochrysis_carterae.AAC.1
MGKRVLVYEGDTDACGLQTAPIEDIWVPFFGNGSGVWTPAGRIDDVQRKPSAINAASKQATASTTIPTAATASNTTTTAAAAAAATSTTAATPLGLRMTQKWRPFGVLPQGRA